MKVVIAPDSFKESLSALQVAEAIEAGVREVFPDAHIVKLPVADGGEGTVQAMIDATGGRRVELRVTGPLGEPAAAFYGLAAAPDGGGQGPMAVIEMAAASGLEMVPPERRNPLSATSRGTGELILHALDAGVRRFVLGVGGSATNDGGAGMLQALGVRLLDEAGQELAAGGAALARLRRIDVSQLDPRVKDSEFNIACDVSNPLVGPNGASAIFGPQKGATPDMVAQLDACLAHYGRLIARDLGQDVADMPGAGAGGGIAAAMVVFLGGRLRPGIEIIAEAVGLDQAVRDADLVITGEGRIDGQSVNGKTPVGVARVAKRHGKPVIAIGGGLAVDAGAVYAHGIDAVFAAVCRPCTVAEALAQAHENLRSAARNMAQALRLGAALGAR
ncbi:glycerate kinase [Massilia sp. WF1]|uniref:glycerate kinase n=1 Tax=unclassified Massilia TaxID=2609279 RepID=UPI000649DA2B|nr:MULTISPECIES: glycerate kinase [unclassified Massilia]ALK97097.1 glycerate kinase [Massilia sp. WG5]KLU36141.1 glycerate kinase [Massilia sp. WF1]